MFREAFVHLVSMVVSSYPEVGVGRLAFTGEQLLHLLLLPVAVHLEEPLALLDADPLGPVPTGAFLEVHVATMGTGDEGGPCGGSGRVSRCSE